MIKSISEYVTESDNENLPELVFVSKFKLLEDVNDHVDCKEISKLLYEALLARFKIEITSHAHELLFEYQNRIYDMIDELHEMSMGEIKSVLKILDGANPYIADIVIMCWCTPRVNIYASDKAYNNQYKFLIEKYSQQLVDIIDFYVVENFCIETLTKTNSVPTHCINLLWKYMHGLSIDFVFNTNAKKEYIEIKIAEDESHEENELGFIGFGLNLEYLLGLGLGRNSYANGSFEKFAREFITNTELIESIVSSPKSNPKNFIAQIKKIAVATSKYFSDEITPAKIISTL